MMLVEAEEAAAPRRRVAVLAFKNLRNDPDTDWVGAATADTLTTKLAAVKAMLVVEREQIAKVVEEQRFQQSDLVNPATATKAGRLLGAQSVVLGSFVVAKRVRFNAHIVDVETGEVLGAATVAGDEDKAIDLPIQLAEAVVESLSKKVVMVEGKPRVQKTRLALRLVGEERKKLAERPTQNADAYEAYGRGVDLDNKHRWKEAQAELERATQLDPGFALAWLQLGRMHYNQGAWPKALESYAKAEVLFQTKGDEKNLAWSLNNMGNVHFSQGRRAEAMKFYEESLALRRKIGDELGVAMTLGNIGIVHGQEGRYADASRCYEESLGISRKLNDEPGVAMTLGSLGILNGRQGRHEEAKRHFEESLAISRKLGDAPRMAKTLGNIGLVHESQGRFDEAMKCYAESLALKRKLGDEPGAVLTLFNMALLHKKQNKYAEALPLAREAAQLAHKLGLPDAADYDKLVAELEKAAQ
jgi:tetratricopeptide (TPR) repeat protein